MSEMREAILEAARPMVQAHGYNGLSFRVLAKAVGIKSASIHYHFPTKGDLGVALARRYWEDGKAALENVLADSPDPATCLRKYTSLFRTALQNDNRMCLCGVLAAELQDLPEAVKVEVRNFADMNVAWLAKVSSSSGGLGKAEASARARAIYAAIAGAQLTARIRADIRVFDEIVETYRLAGLIPG